jgi:hypothetical protein
VLWDLFAVLLLLPFAWLAALCDGTLFDFLEALALFAFFGPALPFLFFALDAISSPD